MANTEAQTKDGEKVPKGTTTTPPQETNTTPISGTPAFDKAAAAKGKIGNAGTYKFPNDLGQPHISDFVSFYFLDIAVPDGKGRTEWLNAPLRNYKDSNSQEAQITNATTLSRTQNVSKIATGVENSAKKLTGAVIPKETIDKGVSGFKDFLGLDQTYRRTGDVVSLMMPTAVEFNFGAGWQAVNSAPTQVGMLADVIFGDASFKEVAGRDIAVMLSNILMENGQQALESVAKKVFNPFVSQAFESMQRRQFRFNWTLTPKNQAELDNIQKINWLFKYHMHPSLDSTATFLRYPSQVDIQFKTSSNADNSWLPRIATCVIKDFGTNYTPNGQWASVNANQPGAPYQVQFSLTVEETVPLVKQDIVDGY